MYQCYYTDEDGKRCVKLQEECWCSFDHEAAWKKVTYGVDKARGERKLTIEEMQARLLEMRDEAKQKRIRDSKITM